jgi:hypothetical protein
MTRAIAVRPRPTDPRVLTSQFVQLAIPPTKPALRGLSVDPDGRIWVEVYTTAEKRTDSGDNSRATLTWRERNTHDVFDHRGAFLGRIQLQPRSQLLGARGNTLWVSTVTDDDEPVVVAYRIR